MYICTKVLSSQMVNLKFLNYRIMDIDINIGPILNDLNRGDKKAFTYVFNRYYRPLYAVAFRYLKSEDAAMDAVQETFMRLWEKRDSLAFDTNLRSLLFTILKNLILNEIRHNTIVYERQYELAQMDSENVYNMNEAYDRKETRELLFKYIQKLPQQQRKVCLMKIVQGLTNQEIADKLNLALPTVKLHYSQALKKLRNELYSLFLVIFVIVIIL